MRRCRACYGVVWCCWPTSSHSTALCAASASRSFSVSSFAPYIKEDGLQPVALGLYTKHFKPMSLSISLKATIPSRAPGRHAGHHPPLQQCEQFVNRCLISGSYHHPIYPQVPLFTPYSWIHVHTHVREVGRLGLTPRAAMGSMMAYLVGMAPSLRTLSTNTEVSPFTTPSKDTRAVLRDGTT